MFKLLGEREGYRICILVGRVGINYVLGNLVVFKEVKYYLC